jgi:hypothetical protein
VVVREAFVSAAQNGVVTQVSAIPALHGATPRGRIARAHSL